MKKYDNYKDSGTEWIGEIPEHWRIGHFKRITNRVEVGIAEAAVHAYVEDGGVPIIRSTNIKEGMIQGQILRINEDFALKNKNKSLFENDLITVRTGYPGATAVIPKELNGCQCFTMLISTLNETCHPRFYNCFLNSQISRFYFDLTAWGSAQKNISVPILEYAPIVIPSLQEQTIISNFLDHKTTQIDNLIQKKEWLIELLQEERIALINQAVTKGLDPNAPMKDSGIEWLGEIPAHWDFVRMRYLCDITTGGKDTENREDDGIYPFYVRSQTIERISTYSFEGEAILTAGDGVGVCKVWHYVNEKFDFHQRVYMMSGFQQVLGKYLFYYLKENFGKEVMKLSAKSTVDSLRRPMFQNFMVAFGPTEEQTEIINYIESQELRIQTIITKSEQEIELLKEYKTALISEVVTGKVDVRGEVLN